MFERIIEWTIEHPTSKDILDKFDDALIGYFEENNICYTLKICEPLMHSYSYRRTLIDAWIDQWMIMRLFKKIDRSIN